MSNFATQIKLLFEQGNSPEDIAKMLSMELSDVLLMLNSLGFIGNKTSKNAVAKVEEKHLDDAQKIFQERAKEISQRIVDIALYETENISAAAKCAIYAREEVTGRNDAKAKRNNDNLGKLINIEQLVLHLNQAKAQINKSLGLSGDTKAISQSAIVEV